jgi:hypothetical protein
MWGWRRFFSRRVSGSQSLREGVRLSCAARRRISCSDTSLTCSVSGPMFEIICRLELMRRKVMAAVCLMSLVALTACSGSEGGHPVQGAGGEGVKTEPVRNAGGSGIRPADTQVAGENGVRPTAVAGNEGVHPAPVQAAGNEGGRTEQVAGNDGVRPAPDSGNDGSHPVAAAAVTAAH